MTYADPGEPAIDRMKPVAAHLPVVTGARDAAGFARLMERVTTPKDMHALVAILAESADPGRLGAVTGYLVPLPPREAHAVHKRLKEDGQPIPGHIREGERMYQAAMHRARRSAAREGAA